jgi:hypothetical protein
MTSTGSTRTVPSSVTVEFKEKRFAVEFAEVEWQLITLEGARMTALARKEQF